MASEVALDLDPRRARVGFVLVCALALVLRVVYVLQARSSPLFDHPQMDALYHVEWARAFARGEDFQPGPFFRARSTRGSSGSARGSSARISCCRGSCRPDSEP